MSAADRLLKGIGVSPGIAMGPTVTVRWALPLAARACSAISARRLLAPMMLVGRTALSVDTSTKRSTPSDSAASARMIVPKVLLRSPETALCSTMGTCL